MSKSKNPTICGICWSKVGSKRVMTPCKHLYCTDCFFRWMKENRNCPACRENFDDEEIKEIDAQIKKETGVGPDDFTYNPDLTGNTTAPL